MESRLPACEHAACARLAAAQAQKRPRRAAAAPENAVFLFFSNKLGCLGSIVVSLIGTAVGVGLIWLL